MKFGFAGWQAFNLDVFPLHSCGPTGAEGFEPRFLGRKTCGEMNLGLSTFLAVLDLTFCIYSVQETIAETLDRVPDAVILNDVDADAGNHQEICYR